MKNSWPIYVVLLTLFFAGISYAQFDAFYLPDTMAAPPQPETPAATPTPSPPVNYRDIPLPLSEGDDDIIRLTPDNARFLRLSEDAASVVVTNPFHASVMLDSPRLLIIMPRTPGTTSFAVLNKTGSVIAEKKIVVSAIKSKYVRIRRMCPPGDAACVPASYFYCPDGCYEIAPVASVGPTEVPGFVNSSAASSQSISNDMLLQSLQSGGMPAGFGGMPAISPGNIPPFVEEGE